MDILREKFNGIEYYLIDTYEDEFSFGTVYHFISKDNDEKFCFYKNDNYVPIKNKIYLKKINKELKINTDILFKENEIKNIVDKTDKNRHVNEERWNLEKEHKAYDEVSNIINELFPDIPYENTMEALDDNAGIYTDFLKNGIAGQYNSKTKEIHIDEFSQYDKRVFLHECIHKLTNRDDFLLQNNIKLVGLIEGATEKICEDKYGDKTSHTEVLDDKCIHINFSYDSTYQLQQIIYRQMAQLVGSKKSDKSIINGQKNFFDEFSNLYGKDLFLYLNHTCKRLLKESLSEKRKLKYLKNAQTMLLTKVFDKKLLNIHTEEDIINYMTELRNFEYATAKIEGDTTFKDYYNNKYDFIVQLAKQKGIDYSKIEYFQYREVDFYPERNCEKPIPFEITYEHINNLSNIEEIDLSKCTRIQIEPSPNFFSLDMILQNNIPISIVSDARSFSINQIESDEEYFNVIKEHFRIEDNEINIYNIACDTYMIIKNDGTSSIYSESSKTERIYCLSKNEVDLEITSKDIEDRKAEIENSMTESYDYEQEVSIDLDDSINKKGIRAFINSIKKFFKESFGNKKLELPEPSISENIDEYNIDYCDNTSRHSSFVAKLNPNNSIYEHSMKESTKQLEDYTKKSLDVEEEIRY